MVSADKALIHTASTKRRTPGRQPADRLESHSNRLRFPKPINHRYYHAAQKHPPHPLRRTKPSNFKTRLFSYRRATRPLVDCRIKGDRVASTTPWTSEDDAGLHLSSFDRHRHPGHSPRRSRVFAASNGITTAARRPAYTPQHIRSQLQCGGLSSPLNSNAHGPAYVLTLRRHRAAARALLGRRSLFIPQPP